MGQGSSKCTRRNRVFRGLIARQLHTGPGEIAKVEITTAVSEHVPISDVLREDPCDLDSDFKPVTSIGVETHHAAQHHSSSPIAFSPSGDKARTELRYKQAIQNLEDALRKSGSKAWKTFEVPAAKQFDVESLSSLQQQIEFLLQESHVQKSERKTVWMKANRVVERGFVAMSPMAKALLVASKDAISVSLVSNFYHIHAARSRLSTHLVCSVPECLL